MKKTITIFGLLISLTAIGQDKYKAMLSVTGVARVSIKPDLGILNISVSEIKSKMSDAINEVGNKSNYYVRILKNLGFNEKEIRTTSFTVSKNRIYRDNVSIDSGYIASQNIRLEFLYDQKILQKIVYEFSKSEKSVDFSFSFELSEQLKQKVEAQIIEYAVKDGSEKANKIAKSAGLKLLSIRDISYSLFEHENGIEMFEQKYSHEPAMFCGENLQTFNLTPDDLIFRDSIIIVWNIE